MQEKIFTILKKNIKPTEKIALWISWGPDSMFLLENIIHYFEENNFPLKNIHIIHCNHNLRKDADKDSKIILEYVKSPNFYSTHYSPSTSLSKIERDTPFSKKLCSPSILEGVGGSNKWNWKERNQERIKEATPHIHITKINPEQEEQEEKLRTKRYQAFQEYLEKHEIKKLFLGHNLTDRIESSFMNMLRGCNNKGFLAMKTTSETHPLLKNIKIIRPLLNFTKKEIESACDEKKIPYNIDPSNEDEKTSLRNNLRKNIFPVLAKLSHKYNNKTNSFFESFKNIYTTQEHLDEKNTTPIHLKKINIPSEREATFAYKIFLDPQQMTITTSSKLFEQLQISQNITTNTLQEFTNFFQKNQSGHKYINQTTFFLAHWDFFVIQAEQNFRKIENRKIKKNIDNPILIDRLGEYKLWKQCITINDNSLLNHTLWYAKEWLKFKSKTRNKFCINQKIPIFYRNTIPIIYKENTIKKYFYFN